MEINDKKLRFTIIADDRMVYVNGDPRVLDADVEIPEHIHAIQWYGKRGEIEFKAGPDGKRPDNEEFFDPTEFQTWFDGYLNAKARDEQKQKDEIEARAKRDAARAEVVDGGKA